MREKHIITSDNKNIYVYDDVFEYSQRQNYYNFISKSLFKIDGNDGFESLYKKQIYSKFCEQDLDNLQILNSEAFSYLSKKHILDERSYYQIRVNCSNAAEDCSFHTDVENGLTFLYYVNMNWKPEWSGQTIFVSQDLKEIEYASFCTPNRVLVFDGSIPHMIIPPNIHAMTNRLSFVIQYNERK